MSITTSDSGSKVIFTSCWVSRAGRGKADSLQVSHSLPRWWRVKWGAKESTILTLQSTWVVTSVKEEQSANLEPRETKARMVLPSMKSSCLLLPEQNFEHSAPKAESLRTCLGLDYKLAPIGTADTIRVDLVQVDPFAVWSGVNSGFGRNLLLCWPGERNAAQSIHFLQNIFYKLEIFKIFSTLHWISQVLSV